MKNKQYDKIIELFTFLAEKHPDSKKPLKGFGDAYTELKKERKTSRYYKKVKEILEN